MVERREKFRRGLNILYLPFYDELCARLPEEWQPCAGIRSFMSQDRVYAQGRTLPGSIVTNAKGGQSPHNYGCASDWCIWDLDKDPEEPLWPSIIDPIWQVYIDAVHAVGLRSGAEFDDYPHNELRIAVPWTTIHTIWVDKGPDAANHSIKAAMISVDKEDDDDVVL